METAYEKSFNIFKQFPDGLSDFEFSNLLEGEVENVHSSALLSLFVKEGLATITGRKTNPLTGNMVNIYKANGKPFSERQHEPRARTRKRRGPYEDEVKALGRGRPTLSNDTLN